MRVLLINPPAGFSYGILGISRPPLGLAYIAGVLPERYDVRILDLNVEKVNISKFPYGDYDVVGISVDTARALSAYRIAEAAKKKGATVVVGGPHVSFLDEEALGTGFVDYVVRNEGEMAFLSLLEYLSGNASLDSVGGVSYLSGGRVVRTKDLPYIKDLDALPFPARHLLPMEKYKEKMNGRPMTTLTTSRGCPFNCEFCSASQFSGVKWRARSVENVIEEVDLLYNKYGYRAISFVDDNFTLNPDRAIGISEEIIRRRWDIVWAAMTRVDSVVAHPEMIKTMARSGFSWTFIGFESGTQETLDRYGKKATTLEAEKAMEILKANKVNVTGAFILGELHETPEMIKQTIRFAKKLDPRRAQFSILTPYPGTRLFLQVADRLITRKWDLYSGMHPTIKLEHTSPVQLKWLFLDAYRQFYGRPQKLLQNIGYVSRVFPTIPGHVFPPLSASIARTSGRTIGFARRCVATLSRAITLKT